MRSSNDGPRPAGSVARPGCGSTGHGPGCESTGHGLGLLVRKLVTVDVLAETAAITVN